MSAKIVVGLDKSEASVRGLAFAGKLAGLIGQCELILVHVIEWSAFSFQTPEDNAERHKQREEEIAEAQAKVLTPALKSLKDQGLAARGLVKHGKVAEVLGQVAADEGAEQIVIGRSSDDSLAERVFGSSADELVKSASVPVTVVG